MASKQSAGILLYRFRNSQTEVLLVHPGGPFWKNKDEGAWSIPKGEFAEGENAFEVAKREFKEETGSDFVGINIIQLKPIRQKNHKTIYAWAAEGDLDTATIRSNTFELEWPPKSGKRIQVPEIDRGEWFEVEVALEKIIPAQNALLFELIERLSEA
jgi:predicted NUDIX family NTP pyrophosphohydrolase